MSSLLPLQASLQYGQLDSVPGDLVEGPLVPPGGGHAGALDLHQLAGHQPRLGRGRRGLGGVLGVLRVLAVTALPPPRGRAVLRYGHHPLLLLLGCGDLQCYYYSTQIQHSPLYSYEQLTQ